MSSAHLRSLTSASGPAVGKKEKSKLVPTKMRVSLDIGER